MFDKLKAIGIATALSACAIATTADARDGHRYRGDDDAALAIGAGLVGLAIGVAIASDDDDRYYYRDRRYYRGYPRYHYDRRYYRDYRRDRWYDDDRRYRSHKRWYREHRRGHDGWYGRRDRW